MKRHYMLVMFVLALASTSASAVDLSSLYSEKKLAKEKSRLESRMTQIWTMGFLPFLTREESRKLASVQLVFPLIGKHRHPLDFYTNTQEQKVVLPIMSLLFLEDLCTAYAWLWNHGYSTSTIDEYVAMLKYRKASSFPDKRYPLPLEALHIPDQALANPQIDVLSLRFRNSAFAFILAHELGHVYRGHPPFDKDVTLQQAKDHETQADHFAIDLLRRTATIPMGAVLFFGASAHWFPNRGDFDNEQEWQTYLREDATHPLNAERLYLLSRYLEAYAANFSSNKRIDIETVQFIARGIAQIAALLEDTELQVFMAKKTAQADVSSLRPRR